MPDRLPLSALTSQVLEGRLDLELPHLPTGYGPADVSITGAGYAVSRPPEPGIPAHGSDWSPVRRGERGTDGGRTGEPEPVAGLPLVALLSQALVAFTIEFESEAPSSLASAATVIRHLDDHPRPVAELPGLPGVTGSGRSSLERHGYLVVEPDPADRRVKRVRLTPRGMQARAAYEPLLTSIEQRWRARHGDAVVGRTRAALEALVVNFENDLPHHPVPDWS